MTFFEQTFEKYMDTITKGEKLIKERTKLNDEIDRLVKNKEKYTKQLANMLRKVEGDRVVKILYNRDEYIIQVAKKADIIMVMKTMDTDKAIEKMMIGELKNSEVS